MGSNVERRDNFLSGRAAGVTLLDRANHGALRDILPQDSGNAVLRQSAFMRAARRDSFRDTVFLWSTPFVIARCSSGCAT
jgi:hypothetical protein